MAGRPANRRAPALVDWEGSESGDDIQAYLQSLSAKPARPNTTYASDPEMEDLAVYMQSLDVPSVKVTASLDSDGSPETDLSDNSISSRGLPTLRNVMTLDSLSPSPPARPLTARGAAVSSDARQPRTAHGVITGQAAAAQDMYTTVVRPRTARDAHSSVRRPSVPAESTPRRVNFQLPGHNETNILTIEDLHSSPESLSDMSDMANPVLHHTPSVLKAASPIRRQLPSQPFLRNLFSVDALSPSPEPAAFSSLEEPQAAPTSPVVAAVASDAEYDYGSESFVSESLNDGVVSPARSGSDTTLAPSPSTRQHPGEDLASSVNPNLFSLPSAAAAAHVWPSLPPFEPIEFAARAPIATRVLDNDQLSLLSAYDASLLVMTQALRREMEFVQQRIQASRALADMSASARSRPYRYVTLRNTREYIEQFRASTGAAASSS